jgi:hypothetical protein
VRAQRPRPPAGSRPVASAVAAAAALARDAWWACSAPAGFFRDVAARPAPQPLRSALAAALSVAAALGALSLAFVRGTASDGFLLVWALALALGLPSLAFVLILGGLVMVRPTALDVRAWEIAGWAWAPAGALALSLAPAVFVAPGVSALAGLLAFPVWHVVIVLAGLGVLAPTRRAAAAAFYLIAVFAVPTVLAGIAFATLRAVP